MHDKILNNMETRILSRINREDYRQLAYFSKEKLPFEWPLVEQAVKDGYSAFYVKFPFSELQQFNRNERYKMYGSIRKKFMNNGWMQVYFEYMGDEMHVALIQKV